MQILKKLSKVYWSKNDATSIYLFFILNSKQHKNANFAYYEKL